MEHENYRKRIQNVNSLEIKDKEKLNMKKEFLEMEETIHPMRLQRIKDAKISHEILNKGLRGTRLNALVLPTNPKLREGFAWPDERSMVIHEEDRVEEEYFNGMFGLGGFSTTRFPVQRRVTVEDLERSLPPTHERIKAIQQTMFNEVNIDVYDKRHKNRIKEHMKKMYKDNKEQL